MAKILRLIDRDTFVECVTMNYTGEWVEEVLTTHNAFKAKDISEILPVHLQEVAEWVREHEGTLVEIVEVL